VALGRMLRGQLGSSRGSVLARAAKSNPVGSTSGCHRLHKASRKPFQVNGIFIWVSNATCCSI
jgi:hypothetical protein